MKSKARDAPPSLAFFVPSWRTTHYKVSPFLNRTTRSKPTASSRFLFWNCHFIRLTLIPKNLADFIMAVMGDSIQSELRTLENLFSRVRLNLERAWDRGSSRCPITAIIKNPQGFEGISTQSKTCYKSIFQRIKSRNRRSVFFAFSMDACYSIRWVEKCTHIYNR